MISSPFMEAGAVWYQRSPDVAERRVAPRGPLMSGGQSGDAVWELLRQPRTLPELVSIIAEDTQHAPGEVARDLEAILSDLLERGLVEAVADADD